MPTTHAQGGTSILELLQQADIVVQSIMAILIIASVWSWTIVFDKVYKFSILRRKTNKFEALFHSEKLLDDIFLIAKKDDDHPLAKMFIAAVKEWRISNIKSVMQSQMAEKKDSLKDRVQKSMQVAANKSIEKLENGMQILAIISSTTPFIGLFGTVWGIMNSFQNIAISKNTNLSIVAPGIAEALLATAFGLFAAIPAVFFYNIYSNKINKFADEMDNFSTLVSNILSRELDKA
ncbi:MAG: biopolymer transport protein [Rickettsiaceae bacterium]|jgi:biopolymer transport protein TolQ|nr:biopolymer transport protein [Rickettsiaceae bacterium]